MGEDFKVKINNPERAAAFRKIVGDDEVFVRTPVPEIADLPGLGKRKVFKLDLDMYIPEEKERLAEHLAEKFGVNIEVIKANLAVSGLPILEEECTVIVKNPQRWLV